jgi:signal transduction histidine kinase/ActR/RegA family two-component response regulator
MDRPEDPEKALRDEVARLGSELEQARVTMEDAQARAAALYDETERLRRRVAWLERERMEAEAAAVMRRQAAGIAAMVTNALQQTDPAEDLRMALEETSVLAEELQAANEELLAANEELDRRVAERTAELSKANSDLEQLNAELNRRIEAEAAARAKAQAELFQMQKLEAIGQLTGGIAHDFNNLLMVIINGLQVLAQSDNLPQRERALRRTQEASWRASELTRRLLAFARRQALHAERVELPRQLDSLHELLRQGLREDIELRIDLAADLWPLEADFGALELALLNLTVNARDAMPQGGALTIGARNAPIDEPRAVRHAVACGDYVQILVEDTGVGMAPDVLEKVFEPFFTTKGAGMGTGLGLAQVYGFAQQSGGTAWVESRLGEGTAVYLLLPRSRRQPRPEQPSETAVPHARPRSDLRVLVVEDEPAVAGVVLDMLQQLGHRGTCVGTVASALALLAGSEATDLVLSDVLLPGGDSGLDLAREMRRRNPGVPMILTSGYGGSMTQRLSTMNLPFLRKPYEIEALRRAIDHALQLPVAARRG